MQGKIKKNIIKKIKISKRVLGALLVCKRVLVTMDLSSSVDPYAVQKNVCPEICGKDCPQRHTFQMQKFPHLLDKSPYSSDIYSKELLQRHASQVQPALYADIYLKDFMPHSNLHIAPHLYPELYAKDFSPIHSMLTQQFAPAIEKPMLHSDIYSRKEYLQQQHNSVSSRRIGSHTSEKGMYNDIHLKDFGGRSSTLQPPKAHTSGEKANSSVRSHSSCSPWGVTLGNNKPYQQPLYSKELYTKGLYNKELYTKELYHKDHTQRLGIPVSKSSSVTAQASINPIYAKDYSLKSGSQASNKNTPDNSRFHNSYNKEYLERSQIVKVAPKTTSTKNETYCKDYFQPQQHSQPVFQQVLPTNRVKAVENNVPTSKELMLKPYIPAHSQACTETQTLTHKSLPISEKSGCQETYNQRSFSQQTIPQVPFSKIQENIQRNTFRREISNHPANTGLGCGNQISQGQPAQANKTYLPSQQQNRGACTQFHTAPQIPTNIVRPFRANESQANSYPSRPENVASPKKLQKDSNTCRMNLSESEYFPSPTLTNLDEKPIYETETKSDKEIVSNDKAPQCLDFKETEEKPNLNIPHYNRYSISPYSSDSDSATSPEDEKQFHLENSSDDEFLCTKSALSVSTTKLQCRQERRSSQSRTFQCNICLKKFAQRYYLQIHNRTHTGEKPFHCDLCPKRFVRRDTLQIHRRSHTGEKPFQCDVCLKQFAQRHYLQIHERTHTEEKPYCCGVCFKEFAQKNYLHAHQKIHISRKHMCDVCNKQFTQNDYLQVHKRSHTGGKTYQCDLCIQKFARRDILQVHRRIHTGERPFQCNFCHKKFARSSKLKTHVQIHMRYKPHQCDICYKQFAQRYYLHIHKRSHSGERPFECDRCHKQFAQKYYLQIHQRTHTGEKPYHCDLCQKQFARRDTLQIHKRTHTGERPYECDVCGQRFAQKDKLQIHQRIHSGERPFACEFCPKRFSQQNTLQLHRRIHTGEKPYKCEICSRRFAQRNYLVMHTRTHSGEKPFYCDHCGQRFARRDTLQIHRRTHNESPSEFPCDLCDKKFTLYDKMQQHKQEEHNTLTAIHNQTDGEATNSSPPVSPKVENDKDDVSSKPIHEFPSVTSYLWQL